MTERPDRSIAGKVALVTGGGRGLGAATARSLTAAGARVFVIDLHRPAAGEAIDERVTYLVGDVTDLGGFVWIIGRTRGRCLRCGVRPGRWWRSSRS
ncbi:SDR family NAD(P)-dependent oxidoreductase, partial [Streptomyces sp. NPDC050287]|uniref:SDR family NAD(P)-dependent oxidoreductase n=1 Tax=Streptomyces sp. NPDC050287 TaxID=3365608 RepID=UPI00378890C4